MNNLSWFIYLIDVLTKFSDAMAPILAITAMFVIAPLVFCSFFYETDYDYIDHQRHYKRIYPLKHVSWHLRWFLPLWLVVLFLITLIPSRETIYMIATSQIGEQIIQLEEVQSLGGEVGGLASDTIELLRQNIQGQLTEKAVEAD